MRLGQRRHHVEIERLARRARLLGLLEHRDRAARIAAARRGTHRPRTGDRGAPAARPPVRPCACRTAAVSRAVSAPEPISTITRSASAGPSYSNSLYAPAGERREAIHGGLHDRRRPRVVRVHRLARLKERVRVVRGAADERMLGIERAIPVRAHQILPDHRPDLRIGQQRQLVELVRGPEAVEEMQERDARLQRRGLRDQRGVVRLLHRGGGQQGKPGRARRHHVGVVAEDRQRLRRQRARRHVEDRGGQLAGDLEHVGQHQHQPLRRREGRRQRARLQRAVHGAGGAAFALHLLHDRDVAPDVGHALRRPLVGELGHRRGRGDRIDRADLVHAVGDVRDRGVAVHRDRARRVGVRLHALHASAGSGIISIAWHGTGVEADRAAGAPVIEVAVAGGRARASRSPARGRPRSTGRTRSSSRRTGTACAS